MELDRKRRADDGDGDDASKRMKTKKQWRMPHRNDTGASIQPGDSGIWATCDKGRERKCIGELKDLFAEVLEQLLVSVSIIANTMNSMLNCYTRRLSQRTKILLCRRTMHQKPAWTSRARYSRSFKVSENPQLASSSRISELICNVVRHSQST